MSRSFSEFLDKFDIQMAALRASSAAYDQGETWEAERLATTVANLILDKRNTTSLLTHLGIKEKIAFISTSVLAVSGNLVAHMPLIGFQMGADGVRYVPHCSMPPRPYSVQKQLPFRDWWEEPVFVDVQKRPLRRSDLVLSLRDQDGGAHIDRELKHAAYDGLARGDSAGWMITNPDGSMSPLPEAHWATMREIAWEVERSLSGAKSLVAT